MLELSRRALLASAAAMAVGAGAGRAAAQSDVSATLKVQGFGADAELAAMTNAIARFNRKYPNVKVDLSVDPISSGWGDYVTKVFAQFNSGQAADVYGTAIETFQSFSSRGLFLPLDEFVASHPGFSDFAPSLFRQSTYKGSIHYIPIGWNNIMINYNRDLFDKTGVSYPKDGKWSWEEFREAAKKLTVKDGAGNIIQFGYEVPNQNFFVQPWFFSNGTGALNDDWTASNMLDPKVSQSLQFLYDLIHVDKVSPIPGKDAMDNQFYSGQVAMVSRGHWIVQNARRNKVNMDVAIPPARLSDTTVIGFGGYAVARTSKQADLAKALILELTSEETQKEEGEKGGGVPGRRSAAQTPEFLAFPPSAALYYQTLPQTKAVPSPANFQEVEKIFIRHYIAMMAGEVSIADGVKRADAELNASFERLRKRMGG